jgi:hypothetical protein
MSEDESRRAANEEPGDEVEAHGSHVRAETDEARKSEVDEENDVEAHGHHLRNKPSKA